MNTQSLRTRLVPLAALVVVVAVVAVMATAAPAQTTRDRGPWDRLDLTEEQREQVRDIVKAHRDASREELREKLSGVLTDEQLEQFDALGERRRGGGMWDDRPGRRGNRGGNQRGCCCDYGRGRRGGHGMRGGMDGPGPRLGEVREERGQRMVERLSVVLDLTGEQKEKVAAIVEEHQAQFKDFDRSKLSFDERQKTRQAHRMVLSNRVKEVLTGEQQEKYDEFMKTMPGPRRGKRGSRI